MPLGNPTQAPAPGAMPWSPTRNYGGGAGRIMSNPWGAKTTVPKGAPMPYGGAGHDPITGRPITDPREAKAMLDENTPQGQMLKQRIYAPPPEEAPAIPDMRRELMRGRRGTSYGGGGGGGSGWSS